MPLVVIRELAKDNLQPRKILGEIDHFESQSAIHTSCGMDTKAFACKSQARYGAGGHFKEKAGSLSLTNQQIMVDVKGRHFQAMFSDIFAGNQNPPLTGDVAMANKA
ncbi:MAG: hypothetical protein AB2610_20855 [Candidatus Thiodiazotropha sp.]